MEMGAVYFEEKQVPFSKAIAFLFSMEIVDLLSSMETVDFLSSKEIVDFLSSKEIIISKVLLDEDSRISSAKHLPKKSR